MMTVETLNKRIEGCRLNIERLEKKFQRILKAEASNYEKDNPYYYSDYDKRSTLKELEETKKKLADYEEELQQAQEKEASRNVQVIIDFLQCWKDRVYKIYEDAILEARDMWAQIKEMAKQFHGWDESDELKQLRSEYHEHFYGKHEYKEYYNSYMKRNERIKTKVKEGKWEFANNYYTPSNIEEGLSKLRKDLSKEADVKYDLIIERTNQIVGQITDTNNLSIGGNGELNGIIIGTKGKAKVESVGSGGYNIQCYHFRVYVKEVK